MKDYIISELLAPPRGRRSVPLKLGFIFISILIVLISISSSISTAYTSVIEQDKSDSLMAYASSYAICSAHIDFANGELLLLAPPKYMNHGEEKEYVVNVFTSAGNSFLQTYSSSEEESINSQETLSGADDKYSDVYENQEVIVTTRSVDGNLYYCGVAPVVGLENTVTGLLEVMMPAADYSYTSSSVGSLSYILIFLFDFIVCIMYLVIRNSIQTFAKSTDNSRGQRSNTKRPNSSNNRNVPDKNKQIGRGR